MIGDTADGSLSVEICDGLTCRTGRRSLSESSGHTIFQVPIEESLEVTSDAPLSLTITHSGGLKAVALGTAAAPAGNGQQLEGPDGVRTDQALQLAFEYGAALPGVREVYADRSMSIWELENAAPYFQLISGGPCQFQAEQRESLTANCSSPATVLRRELYMPGWSVSTNKLPGVAVQQNGLFQSISLPNGTSQVRYSFVPPHMTFGWIASLFGFLGLIWQAIQLARSRFRDH